MSKEEAGETAASHTNVRITAPRSRTVEAEVTAEMCSSELHHVFRTFMIYEGPTLLETVASQARERKETGIMVRTSDSQCRLGPKYTKSKLKQKQKTCYRTTAQTKLR